MNRKTKEDIFSDVFEENKEKVYRLCYAYLYNKVEIEDLFQEVMINVWNNLESFRKESKISTWIYRVTVNTALLYNRKTVKERSNQVNYQENYDINADNDTSFNEDQLIHLHKAISQLKKQERIIITLMLEGLSYEEISEITGITVNYVGVKINRIKANLINLIKPESHE